MADPSGEKVFSARLPQLGGAGGLMSRIAELNSSVYDAN
jgi:hypothetical protein